jgi:hypothetical protein
MIRAGMRILLELAAFPEEDRRDCEKQRECYRFGTESLYLVKKAEYFFLNGRKRAINIMTKRKSCYTGNLNSFLHMKATKNKINFKSNKNF